MITTGRSEPKLNIVGTKITISEMPKITTEINKSRQHIFSNKQYEAKKKICPIAKEMAP